MNTKKPINILVFEDEPIYRAHLVETLEENNDFRLIGNFGTTWGIIEKVEKLNPDILLLDIEMPSERADLDDRAGIIATAKLYDHFKENCPQIIILSHFEDDDRIFEAFCANGQINFLTKPSNSEELYKAIYASYKNEPYSSPYIAKRIQSLLGNPLNKNNASILTDREIEALTFLKQGYNQQEAAALMKINSIKDLLKKIYKKLKVHNQREAENKVWYNPMAILNWLKNI